MGMQEKREKIREKIKPPWLRMCIYKGMGRMALGTYTLGQLFPLPEGLCSAQILSLASALLPEWEDKWK